MRTRSGFALLALAVVGALAACAVGQVYTPTPEYGQYPQYVQYPNAAPPVAPAVPAAAVLLSGDQLDQLLASVALYPDPLLAELFPACTFPQDVASAEQWLQQTPSPTEQAIEALPFDASVQALMHYPTVLEMMTQHMDWTQAVGAAFANQQADVMASVQRLRALAQADQSLQTTGQQQVVVDSGSIRIEPVDPSVIYVPTYDPDLVYRQRCPIDFGVGLAIGWWFDNDFDWHDHWVVAGGGWYQGWQHPRDWDDHPPAWTRERPVQDRPREPVRWTRPPERPAPRITPTVVSHLGLDHPKVVGPARPNEPERPVAPVVRPAAPARVGDRPAQPAPAARNVFGAALSAADAKQAAERGRTVMAPAAHPAPAPRVVAPAPAPRVEAPRVTTPVPRVTTPTPPRVTAPPRVVTPPRPAPVQPAPRPVVSAPAPHPTFPSGGNGAETRVQSQRGNQSMHK